MGLFFDEYAFVSALKKMAHTAVRSLDILAVYSVELTHPIREISVKHLHKEVLVIAHLAIGMAGPISAFAHLVERAQKLESIFIKEKDTAPFIRPSGNVVKRSDKFSP